MSGPNWLSNIADGIRRLTMGYDEYTETIDEDVHAEWVDGEVIVHAPPKEVHQRIVGFVYELLSQYVRLKQLGTVYFAPFEVTLWEEGPARAPDVFFTPEPTTTGRNGERMTVPLNLVVEVISPYTVIIDRNDKLREYEEAGVPEYWIIDSRPGYRRADFYRLDDEQRYELVATEDDMVVQSTVLPDFWLQPSWLWQETLPNPLLLVADIVGTDALVEVLRGGRPAPRRTEPKQLDRVDPPMLPNGNEPADAGADADEQDAIPEDVESIPEAYDEPTRESDQDDTFDEEEREGFAAALQEEESTPEDSDTPVGERDQDDTFDEEEREEFAAALQEEEPTHNE